MPAMSKVPLLEATPGGPRFSQLIYGTWRLLADAESADATSIAARLEACVELGVTTVDTAEVYGRYEVEERLGAALQQRPGLRDKLQIISKLGIYVPVTRHPERKVAYYDASAQRIVKSAEKSLRLLGTDHLDLLLVHRPDWLTPAAETAAGLSRLVEEGKVLAVGVSNYTIDQFDALQKCVPSTLVTNQIELSLFHMDPVVDGTLSGYERRGVRPMAWSPLGGGRLFGETDVAGRLRRACEEMAPRYGHVSADAIAIAWLLALPSRPWVVLGTNKIERVRSASAASSIELSRQDWYGLWEAAQGRRIP
jgi:predicted oxidoreductase